MTVRTPDLPTSFDLAAVRQKSKDHFEQLRDHAGPFGCYRMGLGKRPDLYSSTDVALMLGIMGEDLTRLFSQDQRRQWIDHINSYALRDMEQPIDGSYFDRFGHGKFHANGEVIGALGLLGGGQAYPVALYDDFEDPADLDRWLETHIDWTRPWGESHKFWGGLHCFSLGTRCTQAWLEATFNWLNAKVDPETGWWHKDIKPVRSHESLGAAAHILPIYLHHERAYPYPRPIVDSTLGLQQPSGRWSPDPEKPSHYLDLDALYVFAQMREADPDYRRDEVNCAVKQYAATLLNRPGEALSDDLLAEHPHLMLSIVGALGLLQRLAPDHFVDDRTWTDIFSDPNLYRVGEVEVARPL